MQKSLNLWEIAAMKEIFKFGCGLSLVEFQGTQGQTPSATCSRVSIWSVVAALGTNAEVWGPLSTATYILVTV